MECRYLRVGVVDNLVHLRAQARILLGEALPQKLLVESAHKVSVD